MAWAAEYLPDGAYVRFSGRTTGDELIRANTEFYAHPYQTPLRFAVWDFTAVEAFDVDSDAIDHIALQDRAAAAREVPNLAVAVIAPYAVTYGLARMWEIQIESTPWQTRVARTRSEALRWLREQGVATDRFVTVGD